jgi:hypothetical protein
MNKKIITFLALGIILFGSLITADIITNEKPEIDENTLVINEGSIRDYVIAVRNIEDYKVGVAYEVGDEFIYPSGSNIVHSVIQAHTSQSDWKPDEVSSLYKLIYFYEYGEIPDWIQPEGSHDSYALGAKVKHNGKTWESIINNNVWEPGVYGWEGIQ